MKWLEAALLELGDAVREVPGDKDNPRIVEYHATTTLRATDDETPWCSSFVNWCVIQAGLRGTNSAMARSWLKWGRECGPTLGAVVVLSRGEPPAGHVGFFVGQRWGRVFVIGGNQGNAVSVARYPADRVLGYRWPDVGEANA